MSRPPVTERGWFQALFVFVLSAVACVLAGAVLLWRP